MDATAWLTLALVLITGVYAFLTYKVVHESKLAREQQVLPHLKLHMVGLGAGNYLPAVTNAGPGAAMDAEIAVTVRWRGDGEPQVLRLDREYFAPGDSEQLLISTSEKHAALVASSELTEHVASITLKAQYHDVLGRHHERVDAIDDVTAWLEKWGGMVTRQQEDQLKRVADAAEKIAKALQSNN